MPDKIQAQLEARDLRAIDNVIYEAPKEELVGRSLFNIKTDIHPGAENYGYNVLTRSGVAKIIANGADDLPLVDIDMKRFFQPIYTLAAGIRYTVQELRQAQLTGTSVDSTKAETARRAIAEKENRIIFTGDDAVDLKGVANAVGIQVASVTKRWKDCTSEEIIEQIRVHRKLIVTIPGYRTASLKLLIASNEYEELNKRYNDYEPRTTLEVLRGYDWFNEIIPVTDLEGVGTGGTDSFIIMDTRSSTCEILLPMDIVRLEQEWKYPNWTVPFEERCGGALVRTPYAIARVDGI